MKAALAIKLATLHISKLINKRKMTKKTTTYPMNSINKSPGLRNNRKDNKFRKLLEILILVWLRFWFGHVSIFLQTNFPLFANEFPQLNFDGRGPEWHLINLVLSHCLQKWNAC